MFKMDSLEKRLLSVLLLVAMALAALAVACSSEGLASSRGATVAASVAGAMGPAGPQGPAGTQGPTGTTGSPGQMGPAGAVSAPGTDAREVEFNTVNCTLSWRYAGEGADTWRGPAPLPAAHDPRRPGDDLTQRPLLGGRAPLHRRRPRWRLPSPRRS